MQGLAYIYLQQGETVVGSDMVDFAGRESLEKQGAKIYLGHDASHITPDLDLVIHSSAIPQDNLELARARKLGLKIMRRAAAVGELMTDKTGIAVAGTHGKTTTSALVLHILETAKLKPTALIGAEVRSIHGCACLGSGKVMVVEACEFDRSFLDLKPKIAVITNIEPDHLDYYGTFEAIQQAFRKFVEQVPEDGLIVACGDDAVVRKIVDKLKPVIFYGENKDNDLVVKVDGLSRGHNRFNLSGLVNFDTFIATPGSHMVLDAAAAAAVARHLGVSDEIIKKALETFSGVERRFEILYDGWVTLVDDYGHHPTEIEKTLEAAKKLFDGRRIVVVFQPHQLSRTRLLLNDFAKSFKSADLVLVAPILAVRDSEEEKKLISTEDLVKAIDDISGNAKYLGDFDKIKKFLQQELKANDVVITLGAAKTGQFARELKEEFSKHV